MHLSSHILIVDDDREIRELTSRFLRKNGYRVDTAASGTEMKRFLDTYKVDLVVLDRVMPGEDGLELCRDLRSRSVIPILMLTLLNAEMDRIVGLEMGADDYLAKPFNPHELLARIRAVLRRANQMPPQSINVPGRFRFLGWTLDRGRRILESPAGVSIKLTDGEFELLLAFVERPQVILTREQLADLVQRRATIAFDRSIDMQLMRLRRKIDDAPDAQIIRTIRNKGYIFTPTVEECRE